MAKSLGRFKTDDPGSPRGNVIAAIQRDRHAVHCTSRYSRCLDVPQQNETAMPLGEQFSSVNCGQASPCGPMYGSGVPKSVAP